MAMLNSLRNNLTQHKTFSFISAGMVAAINL
jgi:hypothetical protein